MKSYRKERMSEWDSETLARVRQGLYHFFSAILLNPDEERMATLLRAFEILDEQPLEQFAYHNTWVRLRRALQDKLDIDELKKEYTSLFSLGFGSLCPPHESFYLAPPGQATARVIIQVEREYTRLGLTTSNEYKNLPDHVSAEMEAMSFLIGKEAEAWKRRAYEDVVQALEDQRAFLRDHLGRWFPTFAQSVNEASGETFYGLVVGAADAFLKHDLDLIGLMIGEVRE